MFCTSPFFSIHSPFSVWGSKCNFKHLGFPPSGRGGTNQAKYPPGHFIVSHIPHPWDSDSPPAWAEVPRNPSPPFGSRSTLRSCSRVPHRCLSALNSKDKPVALFLNCGPINFFFKFSMVSRSFHALPFPQIFKFRYFWRVEFFNEYLCRIILFLGRLSSVTFFHCGITPAVHSMSSSIFTITAESIRLWFPNYFISNRLGRHWPFWRCIHYYILLRRFFFLI